MSSKWQSFSKEELSSFVQESKSYRAVAEKIGYASNGGSGVKAVKEMIDFYHFNTEHFTGQGWNKNQTKATDSRILSREKYDLKTVFSENSPVTQKVLRGYVRRHDVLDYICSSCGCDGTWLNGTIALEIHHKNGNNKDNRVENLEYLCPNCHALTETYRGKNKK